MGAERADLGNKDLARVLQETSAELPQLSLDQAFVAWFIRARVLDDVDMIKTAITGRRNERGADAVLVDDDAQTVSIVQGKYSKRLGSSNDSKEEIFAFAEFAQHLTGPREELDELVEEADSAAAALLRTAHERVTSRGFGLNLYWASCRRVSSGHKAAATRRVAATADSASMRFFDSSAVTDLLADYLSGAGPPIDELVLPVHSQSNQQGGPFQLMDRSGGIDSWLFATKGSALARAYEREKERLFARNVRGYVGKTTVNRAMADTIRDEPHLFWYLNNGVTIVCDSAQYEASGQGASLRLGNPQIVNGQQTTRALHGLDTQSRRVQVMVRVFKIDRSKRSPSAYEELIRNMVKGSNRQNGVGDHDLVANDSGQVALEHGLRRFGYFYERKKRARSESSRIARGRRILKKEEVARAVAACDLDPSLPQRGGNRALFDTEYDVIFGEVHNPLYYLTRTLLMFAVRRELRGKKEAKYSQFLVLHFLWDRLASTLSRSQAQRALVRVLDRSRDADQDLSAAIQQAVHLALSYHKKHAGPARDRLQASSFFKQEGHAAKFNRFCREPANKKRAEALVASLKEFKRTLTAAG